MYLYIYTAAHVLVCVAYVVRQDYDYDSTPRFRQTIHYMKFARVHKRVRVVFLAPVSF